MDDSQHQQETLASADDRQVPPTQESAVEPTATPSALNDSSDKGGLWRIRFDGQARMDATCGRVSSLGMGDPHLTNVFQRAGAEYLGDANRRDESEQEPALVSSLWKRFFDLDQNQTLRPMKLGSIAIMASADQAVEFAVRSARCRGNAGRFRVVTLTGSDHGRSTLCRTLSGRPELHEGFGPMVPGVVHCPHGDLKALQAILDETVAAVMLCPLDPNDGCRPLDESYLNEVAELCQRHDIELIMDETSWSFASTERPYVHQQIAGIPCDTVVLSAGLFGGVGGGVVLTRFQLSECDVLGHSADFDAMDGQPVGSLSDEGGDESANPAPRDVSSKHDATHEQADVSVWMDPGTILQGRLVDATLERLNSLGIWDAGIAGGLAEDLAEAIGGFEFVRGLHATGTIMGVETDLPAKEIVRSAERQGLIVETAGETSIRLQLPISACLGRNHEGSDWQECMQKLRTALEAIERKTIEI